MGNCNYIRKKGPHPVIKLKHSDLMIHEAEIKQILSMSWFSCCFPEHTSGRNATRIADNHSQPPEDIPPHTWLEQRGHQLLTSNARHVLIVAISSRHRHGVRQSYVGYVLWYYLKKFKRQRKHGSIYVTWTNHWTRKAYLNYPYQLTKVTPEYTLSILASTDWSI